MQRYKKFLPFVILFFIFNCLTVYAKALTPLVLMSAKKTQKITKTIKKVSVHKKVKFRKSSKSRKDVNSNELKVSSLLPEEDNNKNSLVKSVSLTSEVKESIMSEIIQWFDTRYRWGGKSERGIDCSGFTSMIYEKVLGIKIPRSSGEQIKIGTPIENVNDLRFGDLVFFRSGRRNPGHVGIYIGDGLFAHSSSYKHRGVTTSILADASYFKRYVGARRILDEPRTVIGGE
jgi:murein DD-endopeptidase / murein LD-carboxypeptidase